MSQPILQVRELRKYFPVRGTGLISPREVVRAVDGVSFEVHAGQTFGLVGESGCGKSTIGRMLVRLLDPTGGDILWMGESILQKRGQELRSWRRDVQLVFQDPYDSLNARMSVGEIISEPLIVHGEGDRSSREAKVRKILDLVGLPSGAADKFPHEFSGGQRQRIGIARALILNPKLMVLDEPVSALDVSVQAQVVNLLLDLQREFKMAYVFVAHDLSVVRHVSDRIGVMYLGRIVEENDADALFHGPKHHYSRALLQAVPQFGAEFGPERIIRGELPSAMNPPSGCHFHPRCPAAVPECKTSVPSLKQGVSCHHPLTS